MPYVWTYEGVAWYAYKDPNVISPEGGTYEFSGGSDSASCTLTLKAYIDGAEATIDDPQLTFGSQNGYMRMAVDFDALRATIAGGPDREPPRRSIRRRSGAQATWSFP